jgi:hypothetical protein
MLNTRDREGLWIIRHPIIITTGITITVITTVVIIIIMATTAITMVTTMATRRIIITDRLFLPLLQ